MLEIRFFVKDIPSGKCAELDKAAYIKQQKENKPYRKFYKCEWNVTGLLDDTVIKGYSTEGIKSKKNVLGYLSPYPTVVIVDTDHHMASSIFTVSYGE